MRSECSSIKHKDNFVDKKFVDKYMNRDLKIAIVGLGYVGLPLAVEFSKVYDVLGFDVNQKRLEELSNGCDTSLEVDNYDLLAATKLKYTSNPTDLEWANIFIVTVPSPIDEYKRPDFKPLKSASETIGKILKKDDIVIYESTVYPGATEEECVPVLEKISELVFNRDFFVGYSPERINPGDKAHRLTNIVKVTSGSTPEVAEIVDRLYKKIISAGTHKTSSIKVAEAAKVIENTQRDVNIALVNELALIFSKMNIDTHEVLDAANTKWNFLNFRPGLVGGHCIGVDPYYLTYKAQAIGYNPEIILAGRRINDMMGSYISSQVIKHMINKGIQIQGSNVLILGFSFKENCPDIRNTKVIDIYKELREYKIDVDVHDPWVSNESLQKEYNISLKENLMENRYDAIILAVSHKQFFEAGVDAIKKYGKPSHVFYDVKSVFPFIDSDVRL